MCKGKAESVCRQLCGGWGQGSFPNLGPQESESNAKTMVVSPITRPGGTIFCIINRQLTLGKLSTLLLALGYSDGGLLI